MQQSSPEQVTERILKTAKKFGADLGGITSVALLTTAGG